MSRAQAVTPLPQRLETGVVVERPPVRSARRIVLKVGTRVLSNEGGNLLPRRLEAILDGVSEARAAGRELVLVSSGAVNLGREALAGALATDAGTYRQACAAIGQVRLMLEFQRRLQRRRFRCAQILLAGADLSAGQLGPAEQAIRLLLDCGVIPVLNENDAAGNCAVGSHQGSIGESSGADQPCENDHLASLVATKTQADLLVLLTDVDGVYADDPRRDPEARLLSTVEDATELLERLPGGDGGLSRGGMRCKVAAARAAQRAGCHAVIASGRRPEALPRILRGEAEGTWLPAARGESA